ncbi:hypothetical protein [Streptomyces griseus]|uniref:hypothetical protein n=1 Tax=Streptomyces griseus TaxID=1911 RepID=UPI00068CD11E|nr:hypothetical protein [Streptomyces griseus]
MTQDPDRNNIDGGAPGEWEVLAGPGGPERERTSLRELWQRRSVRARTVIVATAVAVLAVGGTVAYAASSGGSDGGAAPAAAASASHFPETPRGHHGGGPWAGLGGDAVHGEATVKDRDTGEWIVRIWQRGTVEKADGDQVTVRSEDGTAWTWAVGKGATDRRDGSSDPVQKGETAYLVGDLSKDGTRTAIRVRAGSDDKGPGNWRGKRGHGPWGHGDRTPSPQPSGSGART